MDPESSDYLRLDIIQSLGPTRAGASFATSSGDIVDAQSFGAGVFRLRAGPAGRPDYGIVTGRPDHCELEQSRPGTWRLTAGDSVLEITGGPLALRLLLQAALPLVEQVLRRVAAPGARPLL